MSKVYDAVIIGGGPAGLAVATGLARLCHSALVIDSGNYRNGRSTYIHNVVGFDHQNPAEFRRKARADIASRYDTVDFCDTAVTQVRKTQSETFEAIDNMGTIYTGRKLVLAMGVRDVMLPIDGYAECWTRGIFHCLFCQGFEHRGVSSCGLIAEGLCSDASMAVHTGRMALQFSKSLTIYTHGSIEVASRLRAAIPSTDKAIRIDTRRIANLSMVLPGSSRITLDFEDGTQITEGFLVKINGNFVEQLGLEVTESGEIKTLPPLLQTSVAGVFAAGDCATPLRAIPQASAMGGLVAVAVAHQVEAERYSEQIY